jgi:copper chaperone CopZ
MKKLNVTGMHCGHCKAAVEEAAGKVSGVRNPVADPAAGLLIYEESAPVDREDLKKALQDTGFDVG